MTDPAQPGPPRGPQRRSPGRPQNQPPREDESVLPRVPEEDRDEAWGDQPRSGERDAEWYRRQRPPHHG